MLINRAREEEFGYLVFDDKGDSEIVKFEAKDLIRIGETIDAVTYRPTKVSATAPFHLKSPIIVLLEVTRKCDLTCGHCYISAGNPRENEMDTKAIYRVLDELKEREVFHVLITGGEPFLRDDIVDIINYAEECDFFVQVVTNGFSLTEKVLSQIKNNGHIRFALSYLGGLENGMSNDEALNHLKDKMTLLKKYNFPRMSWVSVTKLNIDRKPDIYKLCQDFGAKSYYQDVMPMGRCKENAHLLLDVDDVEKSVQLFGTGDDEEGDRPKTALEMCYLFEYLFQACKGGRSYAYICSNGDVYPCSNCAA
ncbi:MAG: radical SAM protein, partial [Theionarchaea archaeon]|nr:radical SAM protein [Theionarchaea archaeon]